MDYEKISKNIVKKGSDILVKLLKISLCLVLISISIIGCRKANVSIIDKKTSAKPLYSTNQLSETKKPTPTIKLSEAGQSTPTGQKMDASGTILPEKTPEVNIFNYDKNLTRLCINFNYSHEIIKSVVDGAINNSDLEKLKSELNIYSEKGLTNEGGLDFKADEPSVIGDVVAIQKAREYIKTIYDFDVPTELYPNMIIRYNFTNAINNEWLKWDKYYGVSFNISNSQNVGKGIFYSMNIDATSGKYIGGSFFDTKGEKIELSTQPTTDIINSMHLRAEEFVKNKNIMPGAKIVYVFSDPQTGSSYQYQTEVYLDNGYIIDVHEEYKVGNALYFNIFQAHGFKN